MTDPWMLKIFPDCAMIFDKGGKLIVEMKITEENRTEQIQKATLIAAAPELFSACEKLQHLVNSGTLTFNISRYWLFDTTRLKDVMSTLYRAVGRTSVKEEKDVKAGNSPS